MKKESPRFLGAALAARISPWSKTNPRLDVVPLIQGQVTETGRRSSPQHVVNMIHDLPQPFKADVLNVDP